MTRKIGGQPHVGNQQMKFSNNKKAGGQQKDVKKSVFTSSKPGVGYQQGPSGRRPPLGQMLRQDRQPRQSLFEDSRHHTKHQIRGLRQPPRPGQKYSGYTNDYWDNNDYWNNYNYGSGYDNYFDNYFNYRGNNNKSDSGSVKKIIAGLLGSAFGALGIAAVVKKMSGKGKTEGNGTDDTTSPDGASAPDSASAPGADGAPETDGSSAPETDGSSAPETDGSSAPET